MCVASVLPTGSPFSEQPGITTHVLLSIAIGGFDGLHLGVTFAHRKLKVDIRASRSRKEEETTAGWLAISPSSESERERERGVQRTIHHAGTVISTAAVGFFSSS